VEPTDPDDAAHGPRGGGGEDGLEDPVFSTPLPLEDRIWRHPSELDRPGGGHRPAGRHRPRIGTRWFTPLASGLVGSALTVGAIVMTGVMAEEPEVRETVVRETVAPMPALAAGVGRTGTGGAVVRIAAEASPAIVRIEVRGDVDGSGSGVVFRDDGHVLTNAHVVDEAERIMAVLADGTALEAELVGADATTDVAVVKVARAEPLPTALLGSAADLAVGQPTVAIGSPLGLLGGSSVTTGVVSALGREVASQDGPPLLDMIQTDAAIAPGSSGGALLDMRGTVIGITTAIAVSQVGSEGLGFAVPIDLAVRVATQLIDGGRAVHVWLGIEGHDLDAADAVDAGLRGGAEVTDVVPGGPAEAGGLRAGDIIAAVGEVAVPSMSGLVVALRERAPGEVVTLRVLRDGEEREHLVTLEERRS
jgi:S1-C subfamily serine protease